MQNVKNIAVISWAVGALALFGVFSLAYAGNGESQRGKVQLAAAPGAPEAKGNLRFKFDGGELSGKLKVKNLPIQAFGSGNFYGLWFVRTDTDDKAFLGALVDRDGSIIFSDGGAGRTSFEGTRFTTGPNTGDPIALGPEGTNLFIVLIENEINGLTPAPIGPVPGTGVAVSGTF